MSAASCAPRKRARASAKRQARSTNRLRRALANRRSRAESGARVGQASSVFDEPIAAGVLGMRTQRKTMSREGRRPPERGSRAVRAANCAPRKRARARQRSVKRVRRTDCGGRWRAPIARSDIGCARQPSVKRISTNRGRRALGMRTLREDRVGVGAEEREREMEIKKH